MRKFALLVALALGATLSACAAGENVMLDEDTAFRDSCQDLEGRYRASNLRFTSISEPGIYRDVDAIGGRFDIVFADGEYEATYAEPGIAPVNYRGAFGADADNIIFVDDDPFEGVELGDNEIQCRRAGNTIVMYDDDARFDFDGDGLLEPAVLQVDLEPY